MSNTNFNNTNFKMGGVIAAVGIAIAVASGLMGGGADKPVRVASDVAVNVSLIQLIAAPEKFDGRRVMVSGFLVNEAGDRALYLSANDALNGLDNKIAVTFQNSKVPMDVQERMNREYVALRGIFTGGATPEIGDVDHVQERHGPITPPPLGE
jgi:hypothetical protein